MSKLKTAYELSQERIILSSDKISGEKEKGNRMTDAPEFIKSWKSPLDEDEPKEYSDAFIESQDNISRTIKEKDNSPMIESQTYNYNNLPQLHWYGNFNSYTGFSKMNRSFVFGLGSKNVRIKLDNQDSPIEVNEATMNQIRTMERTSIDKKAPKVFSAMIPLKMHHEGRKVLFTMMETSGTLHKDYVEKLNCFDEIWVPTNYNKALFEDNNVKPPIFVMPLGVDTQRYHPKIKPFNFGMDLNDFVFLSVFKWNYRKGWDVLLRAFMNEFDASDNVSLLMVSRTDVAHKPKIIANDFKAIRSSINKDDEDLPHVALYDEFIHEKDMPGIYKACNAFVLPSRGEGFCLPMAEAGACGLPVIASNCSGHTDFLNEDNAYMIEPDRFVTAETNGRLAQLAKHCHFYENQLFPDFGKESLNQAGAHMRYVYENYAKAKAKAFNLTKLIHNKFPWDKAVNNVYKRVLNIQ